MNQVELPVVEKIEKFRFCTSCKKDVDETEFEGKHPKCVDGYFKTCVTCRVRKNTTAKKVYHIKKENGTLKKSVKKCVTIQDTKQEKRDKIISVIVENNNKILQLLKEY